MIRSLAPILRLLCLTLLLSLAGPLSAQDATTQAIDYSEWESTASRAETIVEGGFASTTFLQSLRSELVGWRSRLLNAQTANQERINTIQAQIDALGPAPAEGESEPAQIAARRTALAEQLQQARAPQLNAVEAFNRADGLISEIDSLVRDRETQALLELEPSPVNPSNLAVAATSLRDVVFALSDEWSRLLTSQSTRDGLTANLPVAFGLFLVGGLLLMRARDLMARLAQRLLSAKTRNGRSSAAFLVSLGQILFPIIGLGLLAAAAYSTGLVGEMMSRIVQSIMALVVSIYAALWLGDRLFPPSMQSASVLGLEAPERRKARRLTLIIGALVGIGTLVQELASFNQVSPAARSVFLLPMFVGFSIVFYRFARMVLNNQPVVEEDATPRFSARFLTLFARGLIVVAVVGPILAVIGYVNAAEALMLPAALTLGLFGLFLALQVPIRDLYAWVSGKSYEAAEDALLPVLINFALALASLPVLALIWGFRPEELGEVYSAFVAGYTVGGARITPVTVLAVIMVFAIGLLLTRLIQGALRSAVLPRTKLDTGARNAITSGVGYVGIAAAILIAINAGGIDLTALAFVISALSVGIGFGLQNVVSNFVSGIILLIERPISEGDWIEVGGNMGIVKDISVRSTRIETFDKTDLIVPNADFISGTVTNWTRGNTIGRLVLSVGVAYGTDTRRVAAILQEIADAHPDVARFPAPGIDFMGFGADSLDFRLRLILRDINKIGDVRTEVNHQIAERFVAEGIEIPFAQRDIWLRNPEALAGGGSTPGETPT